MDVIKLSQSDLDEEIDYLVTEAFPDQVQITDRAITEEDLLTTSKAGKNVPLKFGVFGTMMFSDENVTPPAKL